jgi:hypothetical protein
VTTCRGDESEAAAPRTVARVGLAYSYASTVLEFNGATRAELSRHAVVVTGDVPIGERGVLQIGSGGIADGALGTDQAHAVGPGWLLFVSYARRLVDEHAAWPFLLGSVSVGASSARTESLAGPARESAHLTAFDARVGLTAGKSFGPLTPYLAARIFGGPVDWRQRGESLTGTDKYHYQPAVGAVLTLRPLDVYAEWAFAGERAATAGLGISF